MTSAGRPGPGLVPVVFDIAYTVSKHTRSGVKAKKELSKGLGVHVFLEDIDLLQLEQKVWTEGAFLGKVGVAHRAEYERFVWHSSTPIGKRIQAGKPDMPLEWVEVKGKMVKGQWVYHLVPRPRPAGP